MDYSNLADVATLIGNHKQIHTLRFNCDRATADWLKDTFTVKEIKPLSATLNGFFGTPIVVVEHLAYGYIEAEMSDGTREIIKLGKKGPKP